MLAQSQNYFRFAKPFVFPINPNPISTLASITVTQTSVGGVDVLARACIPPSIGIWQSNSGNLLAYCSQQKSDSSTPCILSVFACDKYYGRGNSYWFLLSGIPSSTPTLNVSIFINSTPTPVDVPTPGSIDTLNAGGKKSYKIPLSPLQSVQMMYVTFRGVNYTTSGGNANAYLSIGSLNASLDYSSIGGFAWTFPSLPFIHVPICKLSSYVNIRNGTFGNDSFVQLNAVSNVGSYSIDSNVSYTTPIMTPLSAGSVYSTSVPVGGYSFFKFSFPPNQEWYDYVLSVNVTSNVQNGSVATLTTLGESADPSWPLFSCSGSTNLYFGFSQKNVDVPFSITTYGQYTGIYVGLQVFSGSTPYTFNLKMTQTLSNTTGTATDLPIGKNDFKTE